MTVDICLINRSPLEEIYRSANYHIHYVWDITTSEDNSELLYLLPQQFCQLSRSFVSHVNSKNSVSYQKIQITSGCAELNRLHSLLQNLVEHDFIQLPKTNRPHALNFLIYQMKNIIANDKQLANLPLQILTREVKTTSALADRLIEIYNDYELPYLKLLEFVDMIANRKNDQRAEILKQIELLKENSILQKKNSQEKPKIMVLGEFWCERVLPMLQVIDGFFQVVEDSFKNGINYLKSVPKMKNFESLDEYITQNSLNVLNNVYNPHNSEFGLDIMKKTIDKLPIEGIILINYKFCDVYSFLPSIAREIIGDDLPILELELEGESLGDEQLRTRIEAFHECLLDRR